MESLTRLVSESLTRHGFDRPVDYRRLQWSRWFRCESHHSLLHVPSKPGVFAIAEEIGTMAVGSSDAHVATGASPVPRTLKDVKGSRAFPEAGSMLAVTQFFEDDDMAFVLDRMLTWKNPMRARLTSGRYFIRYVVLEDESQRRSICNALNQWIANSNEKATGIAAHFAASLVLTETNVAREALSANAGSAENAQNPKPTPAQMHSGVASNVQGPSSLPAGF